MFSKEKASTLTSLHLCKELAASPLLGITEFEAGCTDPDVCSAYQVCLKLETDAIENAESGAKSKSVPPIILARILGYLIGFAPSDMALREVVTAIRSCNESDYERLYKLGGHYLNRFIRPFRRHDVSTPQESEQSSRSDGETTLASLDGALMTDKKAKEQALEREGYRCPISKRYDMKADTHKIADVEEIRECGGGVSLQCAHILPEAIISNVPATEVEVMEYTSSFLALNRIGRIQNEGMYSLSNVIAMDMDTHHFFNMLQIWFEKTDIPNQYHPKPYSRLLVLPEVVTFTSPDPQRLPPPSSEFLALHAACAKIARLSGAAEYLDESDHDLDGSDILTCDGTSSAILDHAVLENLGGFVDVE